MSRLDESIYKRKHMKHLFTSFIILVLLACIVVYSHNTVCMYKLDRLTDQHRTDSTNLVKLHKQFLQANGQLIRIGQSSRWAMYVKNNCPDSMGYYVPIINQ